MKKIITTLLLIVLVLSLCGCGKVVVNQSGSDWQLVLPKSKKTVVVMSAYSQYVDDIDPWLLRQAERKITRQASKYGEQPGFYVQLNSADKLELCAEVIVDIDPPKNADSDSGCGIDHDHLFFCEPITK